MATGEAFKMTVKRELVQINIDECDSCVSVSHDTAYLDEERDYEIVCIGCYEKPSKPKDLHEENNRIRMCLVENPEELNQISVFNFTPYEASRIASGLIEAVSHHLIDVQPKGES